MISKVTVWYMSDEELDAYRKKYPPNPQPNELRRARAFSSIHVMRSK